MQGMYIMHRMYIFGNLFYFIGQNNVGQNFRHLLKNYDIVLSIVINRLYFIFYSSDMDPSIFYQLENVSSNHPEMKHLLEKGVFSVQGQDRHPVRTATDQRGEQTINRDAKTVGKKISQLIIENLYER